MGLESLTPSIVFVKHFVSETQKKEEKSGEGKVN